MNNLDEYLARKAQQLDLGRADDLATIQALLDDWYPGKARAQKMHQGKLTIVTTSSSVASELRFKKATIQQMFPVVQKIIIRS